eukprot:TRINITY_DN2963_c0_g1_i10.p1 TRINITY_DN2963_c0_g1~~TRINITY_DN2963_c0_g1_i10.p1  ORF type:complete len:234 (+),score=16.30 TRINITY_DN2963_c0_g1_i10:107-808(+)
MDSVGWEKVQCKGSIPPARAFHGCTLVNRSEILLLGGCDNSKDLSDAYILNLSRRLFVTLGTKKWKKLWQIECNLHSPLVGFGMLTIPQRSRFLAEQILVFGGWEGKSYNNRTLLLDHCTPLITLAFTEIKTGNESFQKSSPGSRRDMTLTYSPCDDKVYLYGGWNPLSWQYNEVFPCDLWSLNDRKRSQKSRVEMAGRVFQRAKARTKTRTQHSVQQDPKRLSINIRWSNCV